MSGSVLVTGANGFIGQALVDVLNRRGIDTKGAVRHAAALRPNRVLVPTIDPETDWVPLLGETDAIVHLAARVHVMRDASSDPLLEYRRVNVGGTLRLATQAAAMGVRRFLFVSSIKVNGETTDVGCRFSADQQPAPVDPYGISKLEAEDGLRRLAAETGMEVTIIRPVLVYGPGVKANFLSMMRLLERGVPLPFAGVRNLRSLVALPNLVDLIGTSLTHPNAANEIFLVSDDEDFSTPELLRRTAAAMGREARLVSLPPSLLRLAGRTLGRGDIVERLCGSLQVDIGKTRRLLGWSPPVPVDRALQETVDDFLVHMGSCGG